MSAFLSPPVATSREVEAAFRRHYETRLARESAITPGQKLAVIETLERELREEGRVPLPRGVVRVDVNLPLVQAALAGRTVVHGGKQLTTPPAKGLGAHTSRIVALVGIVLAMIIGGIWLFTRGGGTESAVAMELPTPTVTLTVTAGPTTPTATALPEPTATPYALALTTGDAAPTGSDPASLEIAGFSYVLGVGQVRNGEWTPQAAEWLEDTDLHRVVAVPWEPNLVNALAALRPGNLVTLRLRSGELAKYKISTISRVQRQQIEVLTGRSPGLSVVLYGEASDQRTVITAIALQSPQDMDLYPDPLATLGTEETTLPVSTVPPSPDAPVATLVPSVQTILVTDTLSLTHATAGIALTVHACDRMSEVQGQPASGNEEYLVCEVELRNVGIQTVRFSDQSFGITEWAWWEVRPDWMPTVNVSVTDALGAGTFAPGSSTRGRLVGLVMQSGNGMSTRRSAPVLVWFQDGIRYVMTLNF